MYRMLSILTRDMVRFSSLSSPEERRIRMTHARSIHQRERDR
jgi:Na+-transporting methylmalonyl-CoA/oxaloacetate decarboxylase beta subunit